MQAKVVKYLTISTLIVIFIICGGCIDTDNSGNTDETADKVALLSTEEVTINKVEGQEMAFGQYYHLEPLDIELHAAQYELPLETKEIANYDQIT
jgi:hypothetical protein